MNKDELLKRIAEWGENGEYERIISAVLALPEAEVDDDILVQLATAYNSTGEYKKAIAVLEGLRARQESSWRWQYCLGYALVNAADDEECDNDSDLRLNILERARTCFSRCMILNPPEGCLEDCDAYMQTIEDELFGDEECDEDGGGDFYEDDDADALEDHIKEHFGEFPSVYRELSAPDIYVDICVIPPTEKRRYYTLVTFGMGSRAMDVPEQYADQPARIELIMRLPPEWKVGESAEEWNWPLIVLKNLGRLPVSCDSWLGRCHTVDNRETFAENTRLSATMLLDPDWLPEDARTCALPSGETVEFFEVVPIYREEMIYKVDNSAEELLKRLGGAAFNRVVDINRPSAVPRDYAPAQSGFWDAMLDRDCEHLASIRSKGLAVDEKNALSHIAIFLRWCIASDVCSEELTERFPEVVRGVKDGTLTDLRDFIRKRYDGALFDSLIADEYRDFADSYYYFGDDGFPSDVDRCAEEYFGKERCESAEFQDEAYLFMPFDEDYYTRLASKITRAFMRFDLRTNEFSRQVFFEEAAENLLGYMCSSAAGGDEAAAEYARAAEQARADGSAPLLIIDGTEAAVGSLSAFADEACTARVCASDYPAATFGEAIRKITAPFTRDDEPVPQEILQAAQRAAERYGVQPLIICRDPALVTRVYIPCESGCYSVSRKADALIRTQRVSELLFSQLPAAMSLYFPSNDIDKRLGLPCIYLGALPIKTAAQMFASIKEAARGSGRTLFPLVCCDCDGHKRSEQLKEALESASQQLVIAQLPQGRGIGDAVQLLVREELPRVPRPKTAERLEKLLGEAPAVVVNEGIAIDMTLFLPQGSDYLPVRMPLGIPEHTTLNNLAALTSSALGCECSHFVTMHGDRAFLQAYSRAFEAAGARGFAPLLIKASPELPEALLKRPPKADKGAYDERLRAMLEKARAAGDIPQGVPLTKFVTIRNAGGGVCPMLACKLAADDAARVLCRFGVFGGVDERDVSRVLALWREKYGAIPALLDVDTLEFYVRRPAQPQDVRELAAQMLALCEGLSAITGFKELAGSLAGSSVWFFCRRANNTK